MANRPSQRRSSPIQWIIGIILVVLILIVVARMSPRATAPGTDLPAGTSTQAAMADDPTDAAADDAAAPVAQPTTADESVTPPDATSGADLPATDAPPTPEPLCNTTQISDLAAIAYSDLPPEAHDTIDLILSDGPFPYDKDGSTFQNREGILPTEQQGYYREYTVNTPDESDRGARRIIGGQRHELYYTDDHYASFSEVLCP